MDRNLGALSANPEDGVKTTGWYYQWGRKDPFPGSITIDIITEQPLYDMTGNIVPVNKVQVPANPSNIGIATTNPATIYHDPGLNDHDWYSGILGIHDNTLWEPSSKTVYDPCPPGWRVPSTPFAWDGLTVDNFPWSDTPTPGRANPDYGGFYPALGWHSSSAGNLGNSGGGVYWASSYQDVAGELFAVRTNDVVGSKGYRSSALSVRCIIDE
jgi:hypothetical protein